MMLQFQLAMMSWVAVILAEKYAYILNIMAAILNF